MHRNPTLVLLVNLAILLTAFAQRSIAQDKDLAKLEGFDAYIEKTLKDWNAPAIGVGIVRDGKLIYAKGFGYRDYEHKLPFTPTTLCPIASNTKLFTAVSAGMLVEEGKLEWDKPIRESVPSIKFYNDQLNNQITLRDMLSHRTGITRHDWIWYQSDFSRRELFDKLRYCEPQSPLRQEFLYNNLMFCAVGYAIELQTGKRWEQIVRERILDPLEMKSTCYSISDMLKHEDHGSAFTEKRDSFEIYKIPYYEDTDGMAPCGAIISNIDELSHWLIALMNDGKFQGKQVLPASALKATLDAAIPVPNTLADSFGYTEIINPNYGMAREKSSYRGHLVTYHGGDLPAFHSQIAYMPNDNIGVIVFVIGDHAAPLYNIISFNIFERFLGLDQTPWSQRLLDMRLKGKKAGTTGRAKAGSGRIADTKPSHPLADYAADYENPAYGILKITLKDNQLNYDFHKLRLPMTHYHYDRFDTADDEREGRFSVNFRTNPQGDIDEAVMSLDEAAAVFTRKPESFDPKLGAQLAGNYEMPSGIKLEISFNQTRGLAAAFPDFPVQQLIRVKGTQFRLAQFPDTIIEFLIENGKAKSITHRDPTGEYSYPKK